MLVLKKIILSLIIFFIFVFLFWTIGSSLVQGKVKEKIKSFADQVQENTGIVIRSGDVQVSPFGEVIIKDLSASFHSAGLPFLSFSRVTVKGRFGGFFSSFQITRVGINTFTFRVSADMFIPKIDWIKYYAALFSKPREEEQITATIKKRSQKGFVRFAPAMLLEILDGKFFVGRKQSEIFGQLSFLHSFGMTVRVNRDKQEITGKCVASGSYKSDNVTCDFLINPDYQSLSLNCRQFFMKQLSPFLPDSIKVNSMAAIDARISIKRYSVDPSVKIDLKVYADKISVNNPRIAHQPLRDIQCGMRGIVFIDPEKGTFRTDELIMFVGHIPLYLRNVEMQLPMGKPFICKGSMETEHLRIQDIIDSLPGGLIPHIKGARAEGFMDVSVPFVIDMETIENTNFDFQGNVSCFRVVTPPLLCDVRKIAAMDYVHKVRLPGAENIAFEVGPGYKDFVPLKNVGRFVIESVLTSEDGNFYFHNGFQVKHVNGAIKQNLREKSFVRGASTVSMQLVKNLFLSNEKTVSRKLEEIMLTWWMEQEINKKRMFEVYLNIIEWGPGIFGIGPAAAHYFHCKPGELSITQATWLACILINPSLFYYMKQQRKIDESMRSMIRFVIRAIRRQGGISESVLTEAEKINFEVYFP
ncbi:MAG: transglycosylase domain-containing protein [Spirochaetales bacterium]|nr:transglycosylase domain-containing protein [Spirochaetales bacterium]